MWQLVSFLTGFNNSNHFIIIFYLVWKCSWRIVEFHDNVPPWSFSYLVSGNLLWKVMEIYQNIVETIKQSLYWKAEVMHIFITQTIFFLLYRRYRRWDNTLYKQAMYIVWGAVQSQRLQFWWRFKHHLLCLCLWLQDTIHCRGMCYWIEAWWSR